MAGLPGSGLGGLFYILLIIWMLARQALFGSSDPERRRAAIRLALMSVAMLAVLAVEGWILSLAVGRMPTFADFVAPSDRTGRWAVVLGLTPFISIAVLLLALQIARVMVPKQRQLN
jgi:hypothetical protein